MTGAVYLGGSEAAFVSHFQYKGARPLTTGTCKA
jgi:hypothetical protein